MKYIYLFDNNIALFTIMIRCAVLCNTVYTDIYVGMSVSDG